MTPPSLGRVVLALLPLQLVAKSFEAALPLLLAAWFGRGETTDVYYFGWAVFALAGSLVFTAFQDSAVVPVLAELRRSDPGLVPAVRGSLLVHTIVGASALSAAFGALTAAWFSLRYAGESRSLALACVPPFAAYLVALSVKTYLGAMLSAEHRYGPSPLAGALGALVTIAVIAAARPALSIAAIPLGSAVGEAAAAAVLAVAVRRAGIAIAPTWARPEPVRRIARLVASETLGTAVTRVNPVVDQLMAALTAVIGGGTLLKLSGDVSTAPTSLLQAALLPVVLTHLSEDVAARDAERVRATLRHALVLVVVTTSLAAAALWAARGPLLSALLAHGSMDPRGVARMARILPYHLVGLPAFGVLLVFARAHVGLQNSRIMVRMGVLNALLNLGLDAALVRGLGLEGLALATSVTYAGVAVAFALCLREPLAALGRSGARPVGAS